MNKYRELQEAVTEQDLGRIEDTRLLMLGLGLRLPGWL
jgi:hypothetical protein